jgi:phosphatidylglycerophosphate synthase
VEQRRGKPAADPRQSNHGNPAIAGRNAAPQSSVEGARDKPSRISEWHEEKPAMLDGIMRRVIDPPLDRIGSALARRGITADAMTFMALFAGLAAASAIAGRAEAVALVLLLVSRLFDGLDGAVARASRRTDRGGFIDIVFDFAFYGAIPLAFAIREPAHALPAAVLLFSFYFNGSSFLAFAAIAAKRGLESRVRGVKSIYFTVGLAEGTETILVFAVMIVRPSWFPVLAYGFAGLTLMSAVSRVALAWAAFRDDDSTGDEPSPSAGDGDNP